MLVGERGGRRLGLALVAAAVASVVLTANAGAAFPGQNGRIVFTSIAGGPETRESDIYAANPDGGARTRLTEHAAWDEEPSFSPDGSRIVFASTRSGALFPWDLYVMDADGGNETALTATPGQSEHDPAFSPDGSKLLFTVYGDGELYVADADGTDATFIRGGIIRNPTFSPDGTKILFEQSEDVWVMNVDGSGAQNLTGSARGSHPAFSPDGAKIVFIGSGGITLMNADGSQPTVVANVSSFEPAFSPDGTKIAWRGNEAGTFGINVINVDGTGSRQIICGAAQTEVEPDWGPLLGALPAGPARNCADVDEDGVPNQQDTCPETAGSPATFGCPDSDGDGVMDMWDQCPNVAGSPQNNGCPLAPPPGEQPPDKASFQGSPRSVNVGKNGFFFFTFRAQPGLIGRVTLRSFRRIGGHRVSLAAANFFVRQNGTARAKLRLPARRLRLLRRLGTVRAKVTVTVKSLEEPPLTSRATTTLTLKR